MFLNISTPVGSVKFVCLSVNVTVSVLGNGNTVSLTQFNIVTRLIGQSTLYLSMLIHVKLLPRPLMGLRYQLLNTNSYI